MIPLEYIAKHFESIGLTIVPDNFNIDYSKYDNLNDDLLKCDWANINGLKCIVGCRLVTAIVLYKFKEKGDVYNYKLLKKALYKLGIKRYPWVLHSPDKIIIVVLSGDKPNQQNIQMKPVSLYIKGALYIPYGESSTQFYYNGIPTIRPEYISIAKIIRCVNEMNEELKWTNYFSEIWSFNDFVKNHGNLIAIEQLARKDGKLFPLCIFHNSNGDTTASLYSDIDDMTYKDVLLNADNLKVGKLLKNEIRYTVFQSWKGWKDVHLDDNLDINKPSPDNRNNNQNDFFVSLIAHQKRHALFYDDIDNLGNSPEDEKEMEKIWSEQDKIKEKMEDEKRAKEMERDNQKRSNQFLYDFSGDDLSLLPELW